MLRLCADNTFVPLLLSSVVESSVWVCVCVCAWLCVGCREALEVLRVLLTTDEVLRRCVLTAVEAEGGRGSCFETEAGADEFVPSSVHPRARSTDTP